jgi:hypothetical protein
LGGWHIPSEWTSDWISGGGGALDHARQQRPRKIQGASNWRTRRSARGHVGSVESETALGPLAAASDFSPSVSSLGSTRSDSAAAGSLTSVPPPEAIGDTSGANRTKTRSTPRSNTSGSPGRSGPENWPSPTGALLVCSSARPNCGPRTSGPRPPNRPGKKRVGRLRRARAGHVRGEIARAQRRQGRRIIRRHHKADRLVGTEASQHQVGRPPDLGVAIAEVPRDRHPVTGIIRIRPASVATPLGSIRIVEPRRHTRRQLQREYEW